MFTSLVRFFMLIACVSAFAPTTPHQQRTTTSLNIIPITNGPTLNSEQAKAAGIGGLSGTKNLKSGGMGAFKVAPKGAKEKKAAAAKKKAAPVAATAKKSPFSFGKKAEVKKVVEEKKPVSLFTKMPWQK